MLIPFHKMSKKAQKAENAKKRNFWTIRPCTQTVPNGKAYSRSKEKARLRNERN